MGAPYYTTADTLDAVRADLDALLGRPPVEPPTAAAGRARHARRALEAAADHAAGLLAALGLPRLVGPGFAPVDPEAAGAALDRAIAALDEADGDADLENEDDEREDGGDDEHSLGWREAMSQADLGHATEDGEHSLGAPERHPYVPSMGTTYYEPANGSVRRIRKWASQATWAQGSRQDGEGESEEGYDLPEGDDERCGSEHDGREPDECREPSLGAPIGDGDQRHWAQGDSRDVELAHEAPRLRPTGPAKPRVPWPDAIRDTRAWARRAEAMKRAKRAAGNLREIGEADLMSGLVTYYAQPYRHSSGAWIVGEVRG